MSRWPSTSAKNVYRAVQRIGWTEKPRISTSGSHKTVATHRLSLRIHVGFSRVGGKSALQCWRKSQSALG